MKTEDTVNDLLKGALSLGKISLVFYEPIKRYFLFLMDKNKELNLISRKMPPAVVIEDHILDCLWGVPFFEEFHSIIDLGTGGGFPGILLAILYPEKSMTFVEKSPKKGIFLKQAIDHLGLKNVSLFQGLVDQCPLEGEVITCRAFKPIDVMLDLTASFFHRGGTYLLYKGRKEKIQEEAALAEKRFSFSLETFALEEVRAKERFMVRIQKST